MKKFYAKNFAYGAAALLVGAVGLTGCSSDDELTNVNPTYDGESVKTQFAINIPVAGKQGTRMAEDIVQGQTPNPTFRGMSNIRLIPLTSDNSVGTGTAFTSDAIMLDAIAPTGELTNNVKFYENVSVPVGTNRFLFYGEAKESEGATDATNGALVENVDFAKGNLLNGACTTVNNVTFDLKEIKEEQNTDIQTYLLGILNGVVGAFGTPTGNELMLTALDNLKSLKAGSSAAILAVMQDLYDMVKDGVNPSVEYDVKGAILNYFNESTGVLSYKTGDGIPANVDNYPACLNIPNGAAQVEYNSGFSYKKSDATDYATYVHPAALYYYVESTVGADNNTHKSEWGGTTVDNWTEFVGNNSNYADTKVKSSTKSVVLKDPIQYAVAQLVYNVKFAASTVTDSRGVGRDVTTGEQNNFELKGILIGGQKQVDYQFAQVDAAASKTIYDYSLNSGNTKVDVTTTGTGDLYSLVLQSEKRTANASSTDQKTVNFALELVNHGEDFYGKDGEVIPSGGTFYLAGSMTTDQDNADRNYVFEQDYKTTANITIASLKEAQYTIPDLRKTELELGLYVDLTWQTGLTFDVTIGGNN